jgi:hypothetical protein
VEDLQNLNLHVYSNAPTNPEDLHQFFRDFKNIDIDALMNDVSNPRFFRRR